MCCASGVFGMRRCANLRRSLAAGLLLVFPGADGGLSPAVHALSVGEYVLMNDELDRSFALPSLSSDGSGGESLMLGRRDIAALVHNLPDGDASKARAEHVSRNHVVVTPIADGRYSVMQRRCHAHSRTRTQTHTHTCTCARMHLLFVQPRQRLVLLVLLLVLLLMMMMLMMMMMAAQCPTVEHSHRRHQRRAGGEGRQTALRRTRQRGGGWTW